MSIILDIKELWCQLMLSIVTNFHHIILTLGIAVLFVILAMFLRTFQCMNMIIGTILAHFCSCSLCFELLHFLCSIAASKTSCEMLVFTAS